MILLKCPEREKTIFLRAEVFPDLDGPFIKRRKGGRKISASVGIYLGIIFIENNTSTRAQIQLTASWEYAVGRGHLTTARLVEGLGLAGAPGLVEEVARFL